MNRAIYPFYAALTTTAVLTFAVTSVVQAQGAPQVEHLTPLQRQQFSQDLVPSSAQAFFKAGRVTLEQEIQFLTRPRSPLNENLLTVNQGVQKQLMDPVEQPGILQRDRAK